MATLTAAQLTRFIGNPSVYAVQREDGSYYPVREPLTTNMLRKHVAGEITIGTYVLRPGEDNCRTLVFDIDEDPEGAPYKPLVDALLDLGVPSRGIGVEFSGSKGWHVWVLSARYMPARIFRHIGRAAMAQADVSCEMFPKQDAVRDLGNLVKVPGALHQVSKKRSYFVGAPPVGIGSAVLLDVLGDLPQESVQIKHVSGPVALECMAAIQDGAGEGWRNTGLFQFATHLRRAGVGDEALAAACHAVAQNFENAETFSAEEVEQVIESSAHSGPICEQLPSEVQCSTCPFRQDGLRLSPGQLKYGKEGEKVVVQIHKRLDDGTFEVVHPDLPRPRLLG